MMVNMMIGCILLAVFIAQTNSIQLCTSDHGHCFVYDLGSSYGPPCWHTLEKSHCCNESGSLQSPINIPPPNRWFKSRRRLKYVDTDTNGDEWCDGDDDNGYCYNRNLILKGRLENNGVYPKFVPDHNVALINVPGTGRQHRYIMANIHIHSGKKGDYRQTENLLNGKSFDAEAHIVHYREDFGSTEEANKHKGGIVVVSLFLSATEGKRSIAFNRIFNHLPEVIKFNEPDNMCNSIIQSAGNSTECIHDEVFYNTKNNKCSLHTNDGGPCGKSVFNIRFNPNDLLSKIPKYLAFDGGLTTPTCSESVKWLVAKYPTRINNLVPLVLGLIETYVDGVNIQTFGNLRPLQNVAGRSVTLVKFRQQIICKEDDDEDDDCEKECEDDDGRECNDDDGRKCNDDDGKCDDDSDDGRKYRMQLNWSMNWRSRQHERDNIEKLLK